jgi:hypothetical protein
MQQTKHGMRNLRGKGEVSIDECDENALVSSPSTVLEIRMKTNLFAPAMFAVVFGLSGLSTSASAQYSNTNTAVGTTPMAAPDAAASDRATMSLVETHAEHASSGYASSPERAAPAERATKSRVSAAKMFQLRDAAGG